jgi:hypothetical protein
MRIADEEGHAAAAFPGDAPGVARHAVEGAYSKGFGCGVALDDGGRVGSLKWAACR